MSASGSSVTQVVTLILNVECDTLFWCIPHRCLTCMIAHELLKYTVNVSQCLLFMARRSRPHGKHLILDAHMSHGRGKTSKKKEEEEEEIRTAKGEVKKKKKDPKSVKSYLRKRSFKVLHACQRVCVFSIGGGCP